MNYLLDTNAVIALLKNEPAIFRKRFRRAVSKGAAVVVSSVVLYELWYGVARSARRQENAERLRVFLSGGIAVSAFGEEDAMTAVTQRKIHEGDVVVIRYEGPKGGPGMREMLAVTGAMKGAGRGGSRDSAHTC